MDYITRALSLAVYTAGAYAGVTCLNPVFESLVQLLIKSSFSTSQLVPFLITTPFSLTAAGIMCYNLNTLLFGRNSISITIENGYFKGTPVSENSGGILLPPLKEFVSDFKARAKSIYERIKRNPNPDIIAAAKKILSERENIPGLLTQKEFEETLLRLRTAENRNREYRDREDRVVDEFANRMQLAYPQCFTGLDVSRSDKKEASTTTPPPVVRARRRAATKL